MISGGGFDRELVSTDTYNNKKILEMKLWIKYAPAGLKVRHDKNKKCFHKREYRSRAVVLNRGPHGAPSKFYGGPQKNVAIEGGTSSMKRATGLQPC